MPFSDKTKEVVKRRAHFRCCLCHEQWVAHVHHIIPEAEGGPDTEENAAPLCANCHDLYGGNPDKRKFIRESRDFWYDCCDRRSPPDPEMMREIRDHLHKEVVTKGDLRQLKVYLDDRIESILGQPLPASKQVQMIADTTAAFSDLVVMPSDAITISDDVAVQLMNKCRRCGANYPASENACPECGTPRHGGE